MFITILLLSIFILLAYNYYLHHGRNGRLINLIPGPPGHPIIGNALQYHVSAEEIWNLFMNTCNEYYPILKFWFLYMPAVSIRHPDDLETILSSTKYIEKSLIYDALHPWFGTGLLTSTGNVMTLTYKRTYFTITGYYYLLLSTCFHHRKSNIILQLDLNIILNGKLCTTSCCKLINIKEICKRDHIEA